MKEPIEDGSTTRKFRYFVSVSVDDIECWNCDGFVVFGDGFEEGWEVVVSGCKERGKLKVS